MTVAHSFVISDVFIGWHYIFCPGYFFFIKDVDENEEDELV